MSYGTKYKHNFKDFYNQQWRLELKKDGYSSTEYALNGGASPVRIIDHNQGGDKFASIRGTELKANLFINTAGAYDFKTDFWGVVDREWQVVLSKVGKTSYLGECEITNLNITNNAADATGTITITHIGDLATKPTCQCEFTINTFPPSGTKVLNIYAVPYDEDNQSPNRKLLGYVNVASTDDTEDVIDKIAALGADWTKIDAGTFEYQQSTFDEDIDSSWHIKIEYYEDAWKSYTFFSSADRFTGATERQWIAVDLISKRPDFDTPKVVNLVTYYYQAGETTDTIAEAIKAGIDGDTVINVFYPTTEENIDIDFSATRSGSTITITLGGIDAKGNYFDILSTLGNDTYIRVHQRTGGDYTWTDVDFSGGDSGGDEFKIEVDKGSGNETIGTTLAYSGDTEALIIQRLVNYINDNNSSITAEVDSGNTSQLNIYSDLASGWTYKFSTDGGSTVTPGTDTAFASSTETSVHWIGWVIPGNYEQEHQSGTISVEISAADGLGDLRNFIFEVDDRRPFELLSFMEVINYTLQKTGLTLNIFEAFDLWHTLADGTESPLLQAYQDGSRLNGLDCYEVLSEIISELKATICQNEGRWEIIPLDQLNGNYTYRTFDYTGNYLEDITKTGFIKDTGGTARDNIFLNKSPKIAFEQGFRKVSIKQNYGFVDQLLKFPSFISINENLANLEYHWNWMYNSVVQTSYLGEVSKDSDGYLHLSNNEAHPGTQFYLQQKQTISEVVISEAGSTMYEFKATYKQDENAATSFNVIAYIKNKAGTDTVWLRDDPNSPLSTGPETITLTANESNNVQTLPIKFNYPTGAAFDSEPSTFYVEIYQPTSDFVKIKSLELKVNTISVVGKKVTSYYSELVNDLSSKIFEKTFNLGDIPNVPNAQEIYKNALYYIDSDNNVGLTSAWVEDPASPSNQKPLIDHIRKFYLDSYARSVVLLTATVLGDLGLRDILKDKSGDDELYMFIGGERDIKRSQITGEWQEIDIDVSGYTLVETTENYQDDSSGSNTYTTNPGSSSGGDEVDLSNYYNKTEVNSLILSSIRGAYGSFLGSDLTSRQITINHNLGIETVILYLYDDNNNMIAQSNYEIDTGGSLNSLTLTIHIPTSPTDEFKYRVL